ncbi:hypothetical protein MSAN_00455100 [Mycena sanguinolenta]|uniref:Uncharacterized protein n=1 Tax=Mycena sanguinolenta TaxID=230812 RepID=A0A8H6ZAT3_9AGAR|nr:hypothetical protein MSAN_00455100 [Mycena sanguinolenta]
MSPEPQQQQPAVVESATPPPPASSPSATSPNGNDNDNNNIPNSAAPRYNTPPRNELKRKTPPMASLEPDSPVDRKPIILPPGAHVSAGEYETGRVICEVCGGGVSFRDDAGSGAFTLKHWEAHRLTCGQQGHPPPPHNSAPPSDPASHPHINGHGIYGPHHAASLSHPSSLHSHAGPPLKRRRAKRTEEERIEYLRADVHVAQFEAYRVLCASCDKWIRLRPNSTYCSIPWDAHRKSCLAKKRWVVLKLTMHWYSNAKNVYALEERNATFAKDPDVRKFDAERILCGMCDKWINIPVDDHPTAVQVWLHHRTSCQKTVSALKNVMYVPHNIIICIYSFFLLPLFSGCKRQCRSYGRNRRTQARHHIARSLVYFASRTPSRVVPGARAASSTAARAPSQGNGQAHHEQAPPQPHTPSAPRHPHPPSAHHSHPLSHPPPPTHLPHPDAPHLLLDLSPANYAAPHESRRRNAEQRAATLRADVLIREVEPNRVFCSLCTKWVQLRQDSSYCAYPWLQHRGKCLARYQRRAQKANEIASIKGGKRPPGLPSADNTSVRLSEDGDEPESEEGVASEPRRHAAPISHRRHSLATPAAHPPRAIPAGYAAAASARPTLSHTQWPTQVQQQQGHAPGQGQGDDADAEGEADDVDADGDSYMEDEGGATPTRGSAYGPANGAGAYSGGNASAILRRAVPASLADLDSPGGRRSFVFASVEYLFRTTYEASDDMSVSALLTYLNAAMPTDKHEDFDTGEVVRAATALAAREKDRYALEGDMIRLLSHESG